ncbi:hypothetical protein KFL_007240025 [Klebsormidium nitens]|uniref:Bacterial Ig-like domain-containing protein n=1 Tax=Klebsormidium nitens TaxID=105231 RepID=A0A1Y1IQP3_KLENI|nr:hypothetical protein KFL_007240025 [Klebsormidium nitens]|eukprot:GAQ91076.1 hypothetical protein KFL_007240025 [Klebsormidium nitens]
MREVPGTANTVARFTTDTPQNVGGILQLPKLGDFTNLVSPPISFQLDPATAALCGTACVASCRVDDLAPVPCGSSQAAVTPASLEDGYHRVTASFSPSPGALAPVGVLSIFFTVDTVPPTVSVALEADNNESPQVFIDVIDGRQTVFMTWNTPAACPGYAVASEPVDNLNGNSFNLEGAQLINFQVDTSRSAGRRLRALLQANPSLANSSNPVAYRFQVVPTGSGPGLVRVSVSPANLADRAGNPIQLTGSSSYVMYYDRDPPTALLQLVSTSPNGATSLSSDPGVSSDPTVTIVLDFDKRVIGFDANSVVLQNGTLIRAGPNAASAEGFSYVLTVAIDPGATLVLFVPADSAYSVVGLGNTASNQLQVLNYAINTQLQSSVRATAVASLGAVAVGSVLAGSGTLFMTVASSFSLFAARLNLDVPLPTPYRDASSALGFALFRWPSPFDTLSGSSPIPYTERPQPLGSDAPVGPANGTAAVSDRGGGRRRALLQAAASNGTLPNGTIPRNTTLVNQGRPIVFGDRSVSFEATTNSYSKELSVNALSLFHSSGHDGLRSLLRTVFYVTVILLVVFLLRYPLRAASLRLAKMQAPPSFLVFPAMELAFFSVALVALSYVALGAIVGRSSWGIVLGLLVILAVISFFILVLSVVGRHVLMSKSVAFVSEQHRPGASLAAWFRAPVNGSWEPVDTAEGDEFRAKYGYLYQDYAGRPSELVMIGPQRLTRSATKKGAPAALSSRAVSGARAFSLSKSFHLSEEELEQAKEDDPPERVDPLEGGLTSTPVKAPEEALIDIQEEPEEPTQDPTSPEKETSDVIVTSPNREPLMETAPGKRAPGAKLSRSQTMRTVHRVGKVGPGAHLRPGWKLMTLFVVAVEAALLGATHGVRAQYWQVCLIVIMRGVLVIVLIILKPFTRATLQVIELLTLVCELSVVTLALALVVQQDVSPAGQLRKNQEGLGYTMIALQLLAVFGNVVNALASACLKLSDYLRGKKKALPVHL